LRRRFFWSGWPGDARDVRVVYPKYATGSLTGTRRLQSWGRTARHLAWAPRRAVAYRGHDYSIVLAEPHGHGCSADAGGDVRCSTLSPAGRLCIADINQAARGAHPDEVTHGRPRPDGLRRRTDGSGRGGRSRFVAPNRATRTLRRSSRGQKRPTGWSVHHGDQSRSPLLPGLVSSRSSPSPNYGPPSTILDDL